MKLITINGAALMSQPLRPPNFVVDTLLSQGLHILAGPVAGGDGGQGGINLGNEREAGHYPLSLPGRFCPPHPKSAL